MTDAKRREFRADTRTEIINRQVARGKDLKEAMQWAFQFEMLLRKGLNRVS